MLAACVAILTFAMTSSSAANRDFICYWAAGHQLVNHANPYDGREILAWEKSAGFLGSRPFFMRNPPSALFLAYPLGLFGAKTGAVLWMLALLASLVASVRLLWNMHGRPKDRLHLVGYIFPPTMACLFAGQIGIFILLGVVLFLFFHQTRPYLSGCSLLLWSLKPHLFLPCIVVMLAWVLSRKAYGILLGATAAFAVALALGYLLDPAGWSHYAAMAAGERLQNEWIPTLSLMLRLAIHRRWVWLQFIPAAIGCIWAAWYFWNRRDRWSWATDGSLLLIVSVMVAPYAWFTDEAVVLPAILSSLYLAIKRGRSTVPFGLIVVLALLAVLQAVPLTSGLYIWTAPAWLAWYLYASAREPQVGRSLVAADRCRCEGAPEV